MQDLFVDRLANVMIVNNVARLDFLRIDAIDPATNQGRVSPTLRVVIPLDGLMEMSQQLDKIRDQITAEISKQKAAAQINSAASVTETTTH